MTKAYLNEYITSYKSPRNRFFAAARPKIRYDKLPIFKKYAANERLIDSYFLKTNDIWADGYLPRNFMFNKNILNENTIGKWNIYYPLRRRLYVGSVSSGEMLISFEKFEDAMVIMMASDIHIEIEQKPTPPSRIPIISWQYKKYMYILIQIYDWSILGISYSITPEILEKDIGDAVLNAADEQIRKDDNYQELHDYQFKGSEFGDEPTGAVLKAIEAFGDYYGLN